MEEPNVVHITPIRPRIPAPGALRVIEALDTIAWRSPPASRFDSRVANDIDPVGVEPVMVIADAPAFLSPGMRPWVIALFGAVLAAVLGGLLGGAMHV